MSETWSQKAIFYIIYLIGRWHSIHCARIEANMAPSKASRHTRIYPASTLLPWPTMLLLYVTSEARLRGHVAPGHRGRHGRGGTPRCHAAPAMRVEGEPRTNTP